MLTLICELATRVSSSADRSFFPSKKYLSEHMANELRTPWQVWVFITNVPDYQPLENAESWSLSSSGPPHSGGHDVSLNGPMYLTVWNQVLF